MGALAEHLQLRITEANFEQYSIGESLEIKLVHEIRHLPSRRKVWKGMCGGREVLVKVFFPHRKQLRDVRREWGSAVLMEQNGILVPKPLVQASSEKGDVAVVYEFIADAETLDSAIRKKDVRGVTECFQKLVDIHAQQHALGAFQDDDHLSNYMWAQERLYVIDTGSILIKKEGLKESKRIENMAKLIANTTFDRRILLIKVMRENISLAEANPEGSAFFDHVETLVPRYIKKRLAKYIRKTRRSSEEFSCQCESAGEWRAWRQMDLDTIHDLNEDPESFAATIGDKDFCVYPFPQLPAWKFWKGGARHPLALVN